jgi:hypothetical protein
MENKSILDQIISNHKAEEVSQLDAVDIISNIFNKLNERERDILSRRFGLYGKEKETLEKIGNIHKLTRERVRQIENASINKLLEQENLDEHLNNLKNVINQLIEEHGGMVEHDYLLNNLVNFSTGNVKKPQEAEEIHRNHLDFLISKLLRDELEEVNNSKYFKNYFKFKYQALDHLEKLAEELLGKIREAKKIFKTAEVIELAKELVSYKENLDKFNANNNLDISHILKNDLYEEDAELINNHKHIYSVLQAIRDIKQSKFGQWGFVDWREVMPKTVNDKIYLILKNHGKPLHFVEIAGKINEIGFDEKKANAATVHNELILDDKYILVGRGLYGLKEWGYKKGTVSDVIVEILRGAEEPMSRDEILEKVLSQRLIKKATVSLALMNKDKFKKVEGEKYKLKD